jgi:hypothetical protein
VGATLVVTAIIGCDTETHAFGRANMAPLIVCAQWGLPDGSHAVEVTANAEDRLAWMLEHDQSWWHNGVGFDAAAIIASYPRIAHLVWAAFERGSFLDTMYLQRMIQIARGDIGGPLALDLVCQSWGIPPPTKVIEATVPAWHPRGGEVVDVRKSFDLWYGADAIPDPWYTYADYDGIVQPQLAARQVAKYCTPARAGATPMVRLEDLAQVCRTYFGLNLARVYGLRVDTTNVATLANAAHNAIKRLREAAITNGFLKPAIATRVEVQSGYVAEKRVCPIRDAVPPVKFKNDKAKDQWQRRALKHRQCPGCKWHATDAAITNRKRIKTHKEELKAAEAAGGAGAVAALVLVPPADGPDAAWKLDTANLTAAITVAYDGKPPLTEPKKNKQTGKMSGGGKIARSRDVLQDSGDEELTSWSAYNEWSAVVNKDLVMFEQSPIHAGIGVTNNLRPSSFAPNVLNLRRDGFTIATCPECGYECQLDKEQQKALKKAGGAMPCPVCESDHTP